MVHFDLGTPDTQLVQKQTAHLLSLVTGQMCSKFFINLIVNPLQNSLHPEVNSLRGTGAGAAFSEGYAGLEDGYLAEVRHLIVDRLSGCDFKYVFDELVQQLFAGSAFHEYACVEIYPQRLALG